MQGADHLAELVHARAAFGVDGVRALGCRVVVRVVAPVVAVGVDDCLDARLLLGAAGAERREVAVRNGLLGPALLDGGEVERGQEVDGVDPGVGELSQLLRAGAVAREGPVGPALRLGHRLVGDREVADVQLVDRAVDRAVDHRRLRLLPRLRTPVLVVEVDRDRALRVRGERDRVRVGDLVGDDLAGRRRVDDDLPEVFVALERGRPLDCPGTGCRIPRRLVTHRVAVCAGIPGEKGRALRGRGPEPEGGAALRERHSQLGVRDGRA